MRTQHLADRVRIPRFAGIWLATGLLFAISPLVVSGSLSGNWFRSMLPFAAILALAAIGQTLVIQQRGLDLSVPGMITLTTVIVSKYAAGSLHKLPAAIGLVVLACVVSGLISGLAITRLGITPLVATLGVNALLLGTIFQITSGTATDSVPSGLSTFALDKTWVVPNTVVVAVVVLLLAASAMRSTVAGRRFVAVGASPAAARAAGIRVRTYQLATYVLASSAYGGAGILLAGFLRTPNIDSGNDYLLPTIAAVVLGGTALVGGSGSVIATAVGALFLTQLQLLVLGLGAPQSVRLIIQGSIIALGMGLRTIPWRRALRTALLSKAPRESPSGTRPMPARQEELPEGSDE